MQATQRQAECRGRHDSGYAYSANATVTVAPYVSNPGYLTPPSSLNYFFGGRGAYTTTPVKRTDVAQTPVEATNWVKGSSFGQADGLRASALTYVERRHLHFQSRRQVCF